MALDTYPDLTPAEGAVLTSDVAATDDVLVKAFALGPGGTVDPHDHPNCTNVFHVTEGVVTVIRDGEREAVRAPGVVCNERGAEHGLENESDSRAVVTASLCPHP